MQWKQFEESAREYPEVIVEKATTGFSAATKNLAQLSVYPKSEYDLIRSKLRTKFQFDFDLISSRLEGYSFQLMQFGYNIELFPVVVIIENTILAELSNSTTTTTFSKMMEIENEEIFSKLLELIFKTTRFQEIVAGLMKIAKKNETNY